MNRKAYDMGSVQSYCGVNFITDINSTAKSMPVDDIPNWVASNKCWLAHRTRGEPNLILEGFRVV